jgi:hypothetical protein
MAKDKKPPVHVVPREDGRWAVKRAGSERASSVHDRQTDADERGRGTAQREKTEYLLHGRDGQIRERDSYGPDPNPPKDKK